MEQHTNPDPEGGSTPDEVLGDGHREAVAHAAGDESVADLGSVVDLDGDVAGSQPGVEAGTEPGAESRGAPDEGRWRDFSPLEGRSQRMHRFTGRLLAAVGDATAGGVDGVALGCLNAVEAGEAVLELHEVMARLKGLQLALLAHADRLDVSAQADGGPAPVNTAAWLMHRALISGRTARTHVRHSRDLTGDFTATGSALLAGDIDAAQAEAIVSAVKRLPADLEPGVREQAEKVMLAEARRLDADQLRVAGHRLLEAIDPDAAEEREANRLRKEGEAAAAKTWLTTWDDRDGTTHLNVKLSTRHADMLRTALHAIANPSLADAIERTTTAVDADGVATRTEKPGQRIMGEAFCRLIETLDADRLPHSGGLSATVVVTIPLETLQGGLEAATMDTGTRLSPGEARRMACDAGLIPVVLGGRSEVLDYGRLRRLFSKPQRVVMAIRQSFRCAAEGCDRPTAMCDAHHLKAWSENGKTDLADGVLICGRHHTLVHHPDYTVERRPGWRISITRTPRQTPRRQ